MIFVFLCTCTKKTQHETGVLLAKYAVRRAFGREAELLYTENGKPYTSLKGIYVSISHTDGLCLAAVSDAELGADAERIVHRDAERLGKRFFTPDEAEYAKRSPECFYEIWTAKESFLKYTGEGLSRPLTSFSVLDIGMAFRHFVYDGCMITLCAAGQFDFEYTVVPTEELFQHTDSHNI